MPHTHRTGSLLFAHAVRRAHRPQYLAQYTVPEYARMRCYLAPDGRSGFALRDGEIVNLFSYGAPGDGALALRDAVERGADRLDCFDGFLPAFYARHGFRETGRVPWDDQYAPSAWNPADGRPDVVYMGRVA